MTRTIIPDANAVNVENAAAFTTAERAQDRIVPFPAGAFEGPFLEPRDVLALVGVALMTLGPLAALPLGL